MDISKEQFKSQLKKLTDYMMERLNIKTPPSKLILKHDKKNSKAPYGYTGNYNPTDKSITLFITGRHHVDILRSYAHEMVHHWQHENGQLLVGGSNEGVGPGTENPQYAQKDPHLRNMEKQSYLLGNMIFRDFEDIERHGETDIVNESIDPKLDRLVNSMVNTVEDTLIEHDLFKVSEYFAYDIIGTNFKGNSPHEVFLKASKMALDILKNKGLIK